MYNDFFNGLFKNYLFIITILGPFKYLQNLTHVYSMKYKKIVSITGTIYDFDANGIADDPSIFWFFLLLTSIYF